MRSVTGGPAYAGRTLGYRVGAGPVGAPAAHRAAERTCRWCGLPSAWAWSLGGQQPGDLLTVDAGEVQVCDTCQTLTVAGDDAALLERCMAALTAWDYPVAVDFLREQHAAALARWVLRRTTVRGLAPLPGSPAGAHGVGTDARGGVR
jgi:hypothetical protein